MKIEWKISFHKIQIIVVFNAFFFFVRRNEPPHRQRRSQRERDELYQSCIGLTRSLSPCNQQAASESYLNRT